MYDKIDVYGFNCCELGCESTRQMNVMVKRFAKIVSIFSHWTICQGKKEKE